MTCIHSHSEFIPTLPFVIRDAKWEKSYDKYREAYFVARELFGDSHRRTKSVASFLIEDHNQKIARQRNDQDILNLRGDD